MTRTADRDESVDLVELLAALWQRKWLVAGITLAFTAAGIAYAMLAPPIYRAEVVLAPTESKSGVSLPAGLGGFASLAGINLGSGLDDKESIATLRSRALIEEFIADKKLLPVLFPDKWDPVNERWIGDPEEWPDIRDGVEYFIEDLRSVTEDTRTGLVTLAVRWYDPQASADWAEELVTRINERVRGRDLTNSQKKLDYLRTELERASLVELRQAISRLIETEMHTVMLARAEAEYAFRVVDPPRAPHEPSSPKRGLVILLSALTGAIIGAFAALLAWTAAKPRAAGLRKLGELEQKRAV